MADAGPLFHHVGERGRAVVRLRVDSVAIEALEGDTLQVALLTKGHALRTSEFGDGMRAGFCLMGACGDCYVWTRAGARLRACGTPVAEGMDILTREVPWPAPV